MVAPGDKGQHTPGTPEDRAGHAARGLRFWSAEAAAWLVAGVFLGVCLMWVAYTRQVEDLDLLAFASMAESQAGWVVLQ